MANTLDAYCTNCKEKTFFLFDGEDWRCDNCDAYNTHESKDIPDPYGWLN